MMVLKAELKVHKQDPCISPWFVQMLEDVVQSHVDCIIHRPVLLGKQTAGGPARVQ